MEKDAERPFWWPNQGWFLAVAGMAGGLLLNQIEAPIWLSAVTLVASLIAATLWPWVQRGSRTRKGAAWLLVSVFSIGVVGAWYVTSSRSSAEKTVVTAENLPSMVEAWVYAAKWGLRPDPSPDVFFRYIVTLSAGLKVQVFRSREKDLSGEKFLTIGTVLNVGPQHRAAIARVSPRALTDLSRELRIEMNRQHVEFILPTTKDESDISVIVLERHSAIAGLNEYVFYQNVSDIHMAFNSALSTIQMRAGIGPDPRR